MLPLFQLSPRQKNAEQMLQLVYRSFLGIFGFAILSSHCFRGDDPLLAVFAGIDACFQFSIGYGFAEGRFVGSPHPGSLYERDESQAIFDLGFTPSKNMVFN